MPVAGETARWNAVRAFLSTVSRAHTMDWSYAGTHTQNTIFAEHVIIFSHTRTAMMAWASTSKLASPFFCDALRGDSVDLAAAIDELWE